MGENFERVQSSTADRVKEQYIILEEDLKSPRDKTNVDTQLLLQNLRSRHQSLRSMITTYLQGGGNMFVRNKNEKEIIDELEIIRGTLILIDTDGHQKAREYLAKNPIKSNA